MDYEIQQAGNAGKLAFQQGVSLSQCPLEGLEATHWRYQWVSEHGRQACINWLCSSCFLLRKFFLGGNFITGFNAFNCYSECDCYEGAFFIAFRDTWNALVSQSAQIPKGWTLGKIEREFPLKPGSVFLFGGDNLNCAIERMEAMLD